MNTENIIINGVEINLQEISSLISQNRKLEAIKYVVDQTNCTLLEAKNLVDDLSDNKRSQTIEIDGLEQVRELLKQNKKIEAVKLVKSMTGLGLKESKEIVDNLDRLNSDQLIKAFKGENIVNFSKKSSTSADNNTQKSTLYVSDSSSKMKKTLLLIVVAIAAIIYYWYQK